MIVCSRQAVCSHVPVQRLHAAIMYVPVCVIVCVQAACSHVPVQLHTAIMYQYVWLCAGCSHVPIHIASSLHSQAIKESWCMHGNISIYECAPWLMIRLHRIAACQCTTKKHKRSPGTEEGELYHFYPNRVRVIDYYALIASHSLCARALVQPSSASP